MLRIVLTGGGTGGHIIPLLAVADALQSTMRGDLALTYIGPKSRYLGAFDERGIACSTVASAKFRRGYGFFQNIIDIPRFFVSIMQALAKLYRLMPDAVFSKGGPGALAVVLAARFYFIPVIIHESDAVPGLTNRLSAPLAKRIAIAFQGAASYFPEKKTFLAGVPVRPALTANVPSREAAKRELQFATNEPLLLVLGGSQGAAPLNTFVAENLGALLEKFQILHQAGEANLGEAGGAAKLALQNATEAFRARYRAEGFLDESGLARALAAADIVLSRAGASAIYELAAFGKPAVLVPVESDGGQQRANAREYAGSGAAVSIEQKNLSVHVFLDVVQRLLGDQGARENMERTAKLFFKPLAAQSIAKELLALAAR